MGKGDKKSRRGKIHISSHGVRRPSKSKKIVAPVAVIVDKPQKAVKVKAGKEVEKIAPAAIPETAEAVEKPKKVIKKTTKKTKEEEPKAE